MKLITSSQRSSAMPRRLLGLGCALLCACAANSYAAPGDLYVSDLATNSIVLYKPDGTKSTFATGFNQPQGLAFDQAKNLYVADKGSGSIFKVTPAGTKTVFVSGLVTPLGMAFVGGDVLVAENGAGRVTSITQSGVERVFQVVPTPIGIASQAASSGKRYIANGPSVLQVNADGTSTDIAPGKDSINVASGPDLDVFVTTGAGDVLQIAPDLTITTVTGGFSQPTGLAFRPARFSGDTDGVGNLYVSDPVDGVITVIPKVGGPSTFASGGSPNFMVFEVNSPNGTPTPTPTATPSGTPTPTPSGTPTPTPSATPTVSPTPTPVPTPTPPSMLQNISTRAQVLTGDKVMIGGFIVTGTGPKTVLMRAIGPSLAAGTPPVANPLGDPVLELHKPDGTVVTNDNWMDTQKAAIMASGLQPPNNLESAILATLDPADPAVPGSGEYTAVLRGNNAGTGVALLELYDVDDPSATSSQLGNLSTRGFVGTSDNVLIGGFILGPASNNEQVLVRAIGPSLPPAQVANPLADPTLELFNADGVSISFNDNWKDTNETAIDATGLAPTKGKESAILANLIAGNYTAIVRGIDNGTGVALVEVYHLAPTTPVAQ